MTYAHVGTSENPLYVTYHEPYPGVVIHHSTIGNSCISAEGEGSPRSIVDAIYALYETRDIRTIAPRGNYNYGSLKYWGDEDLAIACNSTSDLYLSRNGRSENFAELFVDMIHVQGPFDPTFSEPNIVEVTYDVSPLMIDLVSDLTSDFSTLQPVQLNANVDCPGILNATDVSMLTCIPNMSGTCTYANYAQFLASFPLDPLNSISLESTSMLYVKSFTRTADRTFFLTDSDAVMSYTSRPNSINLTKLVDNNGLSAQGNIDPPI